MAAFPAKAAWLVNIFQQHLREGERGRKGGKHADRQELLQPQHSVAGQTGRPDGT